MDSLDLKDIGVLSDLFEFEMDNIRTLFLLAMYEFGKDRLVDEIVTRSAPTISVDHFCDGGVEIVCCRLNYILHENPTDEVKGIMGTLDANMCEWIKERTEKSHSLTGESNMSVPIGNTHLFALRLLSLGASADIDKKERIKIHSLIVLSGSIVKGLESLHHDENRSRDQGTSLGIPPTPDRVRAAIEEGDWSQYEPGARDDEDDNEMAMAESSSGPNSSNEGDEPNPVNEDSSFDGDSGEMFVDQSNHQGTDVAQTGDQYDEDDDSSEGGVDDSERAVVNRTNQVDNDNDSSDDSYGFHDPSNENIESEGSPMHDDDSIQLDDDSMQSDA
jgi:hypothetical protein